MPPLNGDITMAVVAVIMMIAGIGLIVCAISALWEIHARFSSWVVWLIATAIGAALGVSAAFFVEYPLFADLRVRGVPLPICFFAFERGSWTDFPVGAPLLVAVSDLLIVTATASTIALFFLLARERRLWQKEGQGRACGYKLDDEVRGVCPACGTPLARKAEARA